MEKSLPKHEQEQVIFLLVTEDVSRFSLTSLFNGRATTIYSGRMKIEEIKLLISQLGLRETKAILVIGKDQIFQQIVDNFGAGQGNQDVDKYFDEYLSKFVLDGRVLGLFGDDLSAQNREPLIVCEPAFEERVVNAVYKLGLRVSRLKEVQKDQTARTSDWRNRFRGG